MAAMAQLRYSPLSNPHSKLISPRSISDQSPPFISSHITPSINPTRRNLNLIVSRSANPNIKLKLSSNDGNGGIGNGNNSGGGGGGGKGNSGDGEGRFDDRSGGGIFWIFLSGWRSRVSADPQFPFKVLMEELVGVTACLLGDMESRPNFGLNELDFVFSTLVVGSIMNFVLMYFLPAIFASCPTSHMFEPGAFSVMDRFGTFVYKGVVFAGVGFAAGLAGTAISNGLIKLRKTLDPNFETPNEAPPTLLNALTWSAHMGLSTLPPVAFKSFVIVLRCLNNVLGGVSFVTLARLTGSQKVTDSKKAAIVEEKEKLLD
ncbi:Protein RETICULATA-RELATED 3 [Ranunculus cassubicifolius]